jgi:hypothetical protein
MDHFTTLLRIRLLVACHVQPHRDPTQNPRTSNNLATVILGQKPVRTCSQLIGGLTCSTSQDEAVTNATELHTLHLQCFPMHTPDFLYNPGWALSAFSPLEAAATVSQLPVSHHEFLNNHAAMPQIRFSPVSSGL